MDSQSFFNLQVKYHALIQVEVYHLNDLTINYFYLLHYSFLDIDQDQD